MTQTNEQLADTLNTLTLLRNGRKLEHPFQTVDEYRAWISKLNEEGHGVEYGCIVVHKRPSHLTQAHGEK